MGIGEILDVAIKIYRRNAWTLFRIVLVVIAPLSLLANLIVVSAIPAHLTSRIPSGSGISSSSSRHPRPPSGTRCWPGWPRPRSSA